MCYIQEVELQILLSFDTIIVGDSNLFFSSLHVFKIVGPSFDPAFRNIGAPLALDSLREAFRSSINTNAGCDLMKFAYFKQPVFSSTESTRRVCFIPNSFGSLFAVLPLLLESVSLGIFFGFCTFPFL